MPKKNRCRVIKETDSYVVKVCSKARAPKFPEREKFPPLVPREEKKKRR